MSAAKSSAAYSKGKTRMSRVGKYPVEIPAGVQVAIASGMVTAKGRLGEQKMPLTDLVEAKVDGNKVVGRAAHQRDTQPHDVGTTRALIAMHGEGRSTGYTKSLEITGTGYRAAVQGKNLEMNLGFSHPVVYPIPKVSKSPANARPRSRWKASTSASSARSRRKSGRSARRSPIRARARAIPTRRSGGRKAKRNELQAGSSRSPQKRLRYRSAEVARPPAFVGVPLGQNIYAQVIDDAKGQPSRRRRRWTPALKSLKTGADKDAAAAVGKLRRRTRVGRRRQAGRLRPRRVSVSRPGQDSGRCRPRRRAGLLIRASGLDC